MAALDDDESARRARLAYELGRSRFALARAAPIFALALGDVALLDRSAAAAAVGAALSALGFVFAWWGRVAGRAALPGFAAGLVPLLCARAVPACERTCVAGVTVSVCVLLCTLGGFAAGVVIAGLARRAEAAGRYWLCAGAVALLTGALSCSCVGVGGVLGIAAGLAVSGASAFARWARS